MKYFTIIGLVVETQQKIYIRHQNIIAFGHIVIKQGCGCTVQRVLEDQQGPFYEAKKAFLIGRGRS